MKNRQRATVNEIYTTADLANAVIPLLGEILRSLEALRQQMDDSAELRAVSRKPQLTVNEFAELAGRAPYTVRTWIKNGLIKASRVPGPGPKGRFLITRTELGSVINLGRGDFVPGTACDGNEQEQTEC